MKIKYLYVHFRDHVLSYVLIPLVMIVGITSYYRFIIKNDYMVVYESKCDPATKLCFIGCEDDACTKEYFYSKVQKYAPDLYKECGKDITDCETASVCLPNDHKCSITYCDPRDNKNKCTTPTIEPSAQSSDQTKPTEGILQNNNIKNTNI